MTYAILSLQWAVVGGLCGAVVGELVRLAVRPRSRRR